MHWKRSFCFQNGGQYEKQNPRGTYPKLIAVICWEPEKQGQ